MSSIKKSHWGECKNLIKVANKTLHELFAKINPCNSMPIYVAEYRYGEIIGSKTSVFIPNNNQGTFKLGSIDTPQDMLEDLSYGMHSLPLGMVIENYCEWFYMNSNDLNECIAYPFAMQGEGTIFNKAIVFNEETCVENSILSVCSGSRSAFMLSNVGSRLNHKNLLEHFDVQDSPPKSNHEHFDIFKIICKNTTWKTKLIFFSKKWVDEIKKNPKWVYVKLYLSEQMRHQAGQDLFNFSYNNLFMSANKVNKFRPTPFLVDTAKIIFNIAANKSCAHIPAIDESKLPLKHIQQIYRNIYGLKYNPTIMIPSNITQANNSIYYSLQIPSSKITTFKIKLNNSTIKELEALKNILNAYILEFTHTQSPCYGSLLYNTSKKLNLEFFHNSPTVKGINSSDEIITDSRFTFAFENPGSFASDAKFFRGCIRITLANVD